MKPIPANKNEKDQFSFLPDNTAQALKFMVTLSEKMVDIAERETQMLIQGDMAGFSIVQQEKEALVVRYARASQEFRNRLNEFRKADQNMLTRLENLQRRLGEITASNRDMVGRMFDRSSKKTHESLITVQELAQKHAVKTQDPLAGTQQEGA